MERIVWRMPEAFATNLCICSIIESRGFLSYFFLAYIVVDHRFTLHRVYGVSWKKRLYWTLLLYLLAFFCTSLGYFRGCFFEKSNKKLAAKRLNKIFHKNTGHLFRKFISSISNNKSCFRRNQQEIVDQTSSLK